MHFGPHVERSDDLPGVLHTYGRRLYCEAWTAYAEAGCPFGETDEAMLVWFTFHPEAGGLSLPMGRN